MKVYVPFSYEKYGRIPVEVDEDADANEIREKAEEVLDKMSWKDCGSFAECIGEPEVDYNGEILDENDNPLTEIERRNTMEIYALVDEAYQTVCVSENIDCIRNSYDESVSESNYPTLEIWRDGEEILRLVFENEIRDFFFCKTPITKKMINHGFDTGKIRIICSDSEIQCKIQDNAFGFLSEFMSLEEFWNKFQEPTVRSWIYEILKDPEDAEVLGIDAEEWKYYKLVLSE